MQFEVYDLLPNPDKKGIAPGVTQFVGFFDLDGQLQHRKECHHAHEIRKVR